MEEGTGEGRRSKWTHVGKSALASAIILLLVAFLYFDLGRYLSLSYVKEAREALIGLYDRHPLPVVAVYAALYVAMAALFLPGAAVLSLLAGAMFGLLWGVVIVSFSSSAGAAIACFVSRYLLRDWAEDRFGGMLKTVNEAIEREGAFYLFTLRLVPVFPFFVVNIVIGLTRLPLRTFYWVSQVGMLAGTVVYVNAGKELAGIDSAGGILSPGVAFSLAMLGVFPIVAKKSLAFYKSGHRNTR